MIIRGVLFLCFSFLFAKMLVRVLRRRDGSEFMIYECVKGLFFQLNASIDVCERRELADEQFLMYLRI